jgi:hypothetical protein
VPFDPSVQVCVILLMVQDLCAQGRFMIWRRHGDRHAQAMLKMISMVVGAGGMQLDVK